MARMGGKKHLKALVAPKFWPILRKEYKWAVKPSPGPHPIERCFPLLIIVRDILGYAKTAREARKLISEGHFKVDGRVRKNYKYPVGLMDVIEIVDTGETYRVIPVPVKVLGLIEIDKEEAKYKLSRIENKTTVKGGHIQLNLHDGRNVLIKVSDPKNPVEDIYKTLGTLQISIPEQQILNYIPLDEGTLVIISGGRNVGRVGKVVSIHKGIRRHRSIVTIEDKHGNKFQTSLTYVFPIGKEEPLIKLPEGAW
ncbi:SSU ribosomal protein S4E [Staphylothermus marinus F1]|uniref:Small ribosomal subunit protein eS4 n=1 Tax=Staphylothermus marinus (strain ATCC 43588 / DSM 3639 / JCM 9404 / F1) TaxID=399550 RepID=RS4E_STAMF|nr:30S ribosomal protein S4e [Staphylothermus marinus]A3DNB9.1 RecName: Full=Small ribosomal subunit protein eS4; AltName: Full=30S ribosomal protein S4e [Staphylothermus marinus F1]ABN70129.1 SSU ribosomal protein S4E [Staphylothermus marinus F1]